MKIVIFSLLLACAVLLEGAITSLPLVWVVLLAYALTQRDELVFFLGFFAGIVLDIFTIHPLGESSALFMFFLLLVLLYERKYETHSLLFMLIASCIGGGIFMLVMGYETIIGGAIIAMVLGGLMFIIATIGRKSPSTSVYPARGIHARDKYKG